MAPIVTGKPLLKFAGKPLIRHQIRAAQQAGLNQFVIVANQNNLADLQTAVDRLRKAKIELPYRKNRMVWPVLSLRRLHWLVMNLFILCGVDDIVESKAFSQIINEYEKNSGHLGYLTTYYVKDYFPGGYFVLGKKGEIRHIVEKPRRGEEPSKFINIVLHLISRPQILFDYLTRAGNNTDDLYETDSGPDYSGMAIA